MTKRHSWSDPIRRMPTETEVEQAERECYDCGLLKITMHWPEGVPGIRWVLPDGSVVNGGRTPPCGDVEAIEEMPDPAPAAAAPAIAAAPPGALLRAIDTETCGFPDKGNGQVVEVGTLDLVNEDGAWKRGRAWSSLVNPGRPIPPEASAIHHITDDMVKDAPRLADLLPQIFDGAGVLVAHEARFDRECLKVSGAAGVDVLPWICTRKCSTAAWPEAPAFGNQTLRYWLGLKLADPSLATPHRAAGDVYVTAAIARRLLAAGNSVDTMIAVSASPIMLPKLFFGEHAGKPIAEVPTSYFDWIVNPKKPHNKPFDEDVLHTARCQLEDRRAAQRSRSPV